MSSRKHLCTHLHHSAWLRDQYAPQAPDPEASRRNAEGLRSLAHHLAALPSSDDAVQILQLLFGDEWQPLKVACTSHEGNPAPAHLPSGYRRDQHAPASAAAHREFLAMTLLPALAEAQRSQADLVIPDAGQ